jgi:thiamine kinase-like enzyme
VYYRRAEFCYAFFFWAKGLHVKDSDKEIVPVYGGKCLSRKAIQKWVEKFSQGRSKFADDGTEVRKWLKQQFFISMLPVSTHW